MKSYHFWKTAIDHAGTRYVDRAVARYEEEARVFEDAKTKDENELQEYKATAEADLISLKEQVKQKEKELVVANVSFNCLALELK